MKKILVLFLFSVGCSLYAQQFSADMKKADIMKVCDAVAKWQINHQKEVKHHPLDWTNGALYRGMTEWGKVSGNETCYDFVREIGEKYNWNMWDRVYHADDICVGQAFIEMYRKLGDKRMLQPVMERAYYVATHPSKAPLLKTDAVGTLERWSWADALFMAPPVYAALYTMTGDDVYLNYMNSEYKECVDSLYDEEYSLFYRDNKRIPMREKNGAKQFWGRGNGWVLGGLVEILKELPKKDKNRKFYEELFVKLATRVAGLQHPDGFWHASLLDPASYPSPETSCTTFIVYSIAYGINEGLLDKETYLPVMIEGWKALVSAVGPDGKLGYVQQIGADPKKVTRDMTEVYGVGAFLMAGNEIYKMAK